MPDFVVSTGFKAVDKGISSFFKKFGLNAQTAGGKVDRAFKRASKSASGFKNITKGILAAGAIRKGFGLLQRGLGTVTREFISFDDAITGAGARFKDIGPGAENFQKQLDGLRERARLAGSTTEFTATQAAEALDFLAKAGFTSAEAMGSLDLMINLATASGEDFARVADISSDLLGAFGLNADNAAEKIANLGRLNDVLVKTANSANVTIEDMFETMKVAGPIATTIGAQIEEVAAVTAVLGNSGIKGSIAATALKNAMLRLAAPTKEVLGGLGKLGIRTEELQDASGNMLKFTDILKLLQPKLAKLGTRDQAAIMDSIFGKRAIAGAKNLISNLGQIDQLEATLKAAGGTAAQTAAKMRESLGNQIKTLASAATELGFKFLNAFAGEGKQGIKDLTKAIRNFDVKPLVDGLKMAFTVVSTVFNIVRPFIPLIITLVVVLKTWAVVQSILAIATNLTLAPVTAIIIGVIAFTAVVITIIKHSDTLVKSFIMLGNAIMKFLLAPINLVLLSFQLLFKSISILFGSDIAGKMSTELAAFREEANRALQFNPELQQNINTQAAEAPNKTEAQNRNINFLGQLNIAGAPQGSTFEQKTTSAPPLEISMLGAN